MNNNYINLYNKLISLTRNKILYKNFTTQDSFSDRLIFFLFHFAFFVKTFKNDTTKTDMQNIYDYIFRQLELNIREIGYGDQSINKKMKDYLNLFHAILDKIHFWENLDDLSKKRLFLIFLDNSFDTTHLVCYFEEYRLKLINNTLNSYIKSVNKD
jgi:cytochrome b pre-mRNA-processing protein 3